MKWLITTLTITMAYRQFFPEVKIQLAYKSTGPICFIYTKSGTISSRKNTILCLEKIGLCLT